VRGCAVLDGVSEGQISGDKMRGEGTKKFWTFVAALVVGVISGALVSELLRMILPTGVVRDFLTYKINFGFETITLNLALMKVSFGLRFDFTIVSLLFVVAVVYYFKWWL